VAATARAGPGSSWSLISATVRDAAAGAHVRARLDLFPSRCFRPAAAPRAVVVADAPEGADEVARLDPSPEVGKVISDGDGERGAMPVLLPAHHRPVGCREWVFLYAHLVGRGGCRHCRLADTESANMCTSSSARAWQPSCSESARYGTTDTNTAVTLRDHPGVDGEVNRHRWARRWPGLPGSRPDPEGAR
jgi:hypothetical protein